MAIVWWSVPKVRTVGATLTWRRVAKNTRVDIRAALRVVRGIGARLDAPRPNANSASRPKRGSRRTRGLIGPTNRLHYGWRTTTRKGCRRGTHTGGGGGWRTTQ